MSRKARILLTNDDGISAPGIQALFRALDKVFDVLVAAPLYEKSGAGCSLSLADEMQVIPQKHNDRTWGYAVDGTPADCVKFAMSAVKDFEPDFVLSGINNGMNAGNSIFYSGTVAGAIEATLYGYPAMACSLACWGEREPHFDDAAQVVRGLMPWLLDQDPEPRTLWNLNLPNRRFKDFKGIRLSSHGTAFFADEFELYREEDDQRFYKNVGSKLVACAVNDDSDDRVVKQGYVSLSLLRTNLTVPMPRAAVKSLEASWRDFFHSEKKTR